MKRHVRLMLFTAGVLLAPTIGSAQEGQVSAHLTRSRSLPATSLLARPARLQIEDLSLQEALSELEQGAGIALAYSPSLLPAGLRVSCACEESTVGEALQSLLAATQFTFRETREQIILVRRGAEGTDTREAARERLASSAPGQGSARALREAPAPAIIAGRVTTEGQLPLPGALVTVVGLPHSTFANAAGEYRLLIPESQVTPGPAVLRVSQVGYRTREVAFTMAPGAIQVDVVLSVDAILLDELVVTGTAGAQVRRAQPAVISSVDAASVVAKGSVTSVTQVLKGQVPGLVVTESSGTTGSSARVNIRGAASLSLSNEPLVFIDGVRMESQQRSLLNVGGQTPSALSDLNPADILRIEVVKGPAAATLYGADASAGVIQIFTKRGQAGVPSFKQSVSLEYNHIDPNFTPYTNYARCSAALVDPANNHPLCQGLAVGTPVGDNPLVREGAFRNGNFRSLQYSAQGGGENFGYYASFGVDDEEGTTRGNGMARRTGRVNFNWLASEKMSLNATLGFGRNEVELPQGDQASYGYLIAGNLGSPLTVRRAADGSLTGGWMQSTHSVESISSITSEFTTTRLTPSAQLEYRPREWFSNRLTVGADINYSNAVQFYPKNDHNWYTGDYANGWVRSIRDRTDLYTVDYLGNIRLSWGGEGEFTSDLSFGTQFINRVSDVLAATGIGLTTNTANLISGAATNNSSEGFNQQKSLGLFVQEQIGYRDRLFVQLGARVDRNSAFGADVGSFFLPKAGISYVVSQEPFWEGLAEIVSTLRVRGAIGTTGRAPTPGASLQTYRAASYVTDDGVVRPGIVPANPGNPDLRPERGRELEAGLDAGFLGDRVGVEVTYFNKRTTDLLVQVPQAPSSGFSARPYRNIGEVLNRGVEFALRATPVSRGAVTWDVAFQGSTLHNELVSLGDVEPFINNFRAFTPGQQLGVWYVNRIRELDPANNRVIVSDTAEVLGNQMPTFEGALSTSITLFQNLRIAAQFTAKTGHLVQNMGQEYRDRYFQNSEKVVLDADQGGYSDLERLRRFGPYVGETSGRAIPFTEVKEDYIQPGDYIRLSDLTATFTLPAKLVSRFGGSGASLTVGGRNLALWTKFGGYDPEVLGTGPGVAGSSYYDQFYSVELFSTPPSRRWIARLDVQF